MRDFLKILKKLRCSLSFPALCFRSFQIVTDERTSTCYRQVQKNEVEGGEKARNQLNGWEKKYWS